jgi:hypothetical protein
MFFIGSRYSNMTQYTFTKPDGSVVRVTKTPLPSAAAPFGYHRHVGGERLDHIAARYLADPTAFWQLCDANNSMVPDTLAVRPLIGIPPMNG